MAIGKVNYKTGQNLEPIASAITSMNQSSTKKDKPIEMAQKIKAISTDATATEENVLNGQTFYSGGSKKIGSMPNNGTWSSSLYVNDTVTIPKGYHDGNGKVTQSISEHGITTPTVGVTGTNPMYVKIEDGYYPYTVSFGYPRIRVPLSDLRGAGLALQSEVDSMTNDRNNWMNVANSRSIKHTGTLSQGTTFVFNVNSIPNIFLNWKSSSGYCHGIIYKMIYVDIPYLCIDCFNFGGTYIKGKHSNLEIDATNISFYASGSTGLSDNPHFRLDIQSGTLTLTATVVSSSTTITYEYYT